MATSSRSSGKLILAVIVLACAGAVVWHQYSDEEKASLLAPAKEQVQSVLGSSGGSAEDNPAAGSGDAQETASRKAASGSRIKEGRSAHEVSAAISMAPRSEDKGGDSAQGSLNRDGGASADGKAPVDELTARVDRAIAGGGPEAPDGDSVSGVLGTEAPSKDTLKEDSVVTGDFVQDLASWMASQYRPSSREDRSGYSTVTLEKANSRYSSSPRLRSVEKDIVSSRASILNYVYKPGMMEALYLLYAPRFMDALEDAARRPVRNRTLENWQIADMFTVYGNQFRQLASSLEAAAGVDLPALVGAIHEAGRKERLASEKFALAYTAHAVALDDGNKAEAEVQSRRMMDQSRLAGMYAAEQDQARRRLVAELRGQGRNAVLSNGDLVFMSEWIVRHKGSVDATRVAASVCARMAGLCEERARALLAPASPEQENSAPAVPEPAQSNTPGEASLQTTPMPAASSENVSASSSGKASAVPSEPAPAPGMPEVSGSGQAPASDTGVTSGQAAVSPAPSVPAEEAGKNPAPASPDVPAGSTTTGTGAAPAASPEAAPSANPSTSPSEVQSPESPAVLSSSGTNPSPDHSSSAVTDAPTPGSTGAVVPGGESAALAL